MERKDFVMSLAKLMVASAWADGEVSNDEINALKELLFTLDDVTGSDWKELEIYIDSAVGADETEQLLRVVLEGIRSTGEKDLVVANLRNLFECDGAVTPEEQDLLNEIESSVSAVGTGFLSKMSKALKAAMGKRAASAQATCLREENLEDYVKNTVYYQLQREQERRGVRVDLPEGDLRKICLATGLLARIAGADEETSEDERKAMRGIIAKDWGLGEEQADLLVAIACDRVTKGLDRLRLSHGFFDCTTRGERRDFLKTLFKIAAASERTTHEEIEEIHRIGKGLKLSHSDVIAAKLAAPR